jgi:hypothetical protein
MGAPNDLAPWASDVRVKNRKLIVTLRRGLDVNGLMNLLKTQDLSNVKSIKVPGSVGLSGLRALLSSNRCKSLTSLSLNGFADADDAIDVVFETPSMAQLRVLRVSGVSDAIDTRLARGDFVHSLRQLEIRHSPDLTSLDRYFGCPRIGALRFLTIHHTGLADACTLFDNPASSKLVSLTLVRCEFDAETVEDLINARHLDSLRKLNLSYNREDDVVGAIYRLLNSRRFKNLESLSLCGCEIEGFDWYRVDFPELRYLDLRENPLGLDEILEIVDAPGLPCLAKLVVSSPEESLPSQIDRRIVFDDRMPAWNR